MRFMMLVIPKDYETAAPDAAPDAKAVERMMKYNEDLAKAGVLLSLDGLQPPSAGVRVSFTGGKPKVTDGPFAEAKECVGGYWMIQVKSQGRSHRVGQARADGAITRPSRCGRSRKWRTSRRTCRPRLQASRICSGREVNGQRSM